MSRSLLLGKLAALTRLVARADAAGAPGHEALDGAPLPGVSLPGVSLPGAPLADARIGRRAMLRATAAATAGASLAACGADQVLAPPPPRAAKAGGTDRTRVAVVGAGLAGLTCAYRLRQAGVSATVYEASDRLGGRCWTNRSTFDGQLAEHGGELIDQSHVAIRKIAQELGLPLDNVLAAEPRGTEPFFHFDGRPYPVAEVAADLKAVWQPLKRDYVEAGYPTLYTSSTPRGRELDAMSIAAWIDSRVPGGRRSRLGQLLEVAYVIEYGAEAAEQSALNLVYLLGAVGQGSPRLFGPSNEKYKVRGGNDLIVRRLAAALGSQITTGAALTSIARSGSAYTLGFDGRSAVTADRVVLALPFSVLRERVSRSAAGFGAKKEQAIRELGMGANAKLALRFRTRHWSALGCSGDSFADTGYQATWEVTRAQPGAAGILVNYTGGAVAHAQGGRMPAALATEFLQRVEPVLPGLAARHDGRVSFDDWPRDPWTLGSYSFWKVGQYTAFAGAEGEVSGACHFAGEHTSVDYQGYLNGAVESGDRAAREVLAALGLVPHA